MVTCDEVGTTADEMIEVFTGMKQLQLTAIQITKLQELRTDLIQGCIDLILDIRLGIAVNIDIKLDYYSQQQTYMHM